MSEFRMPSQGADMQFGTIVDWRVKPGAAVKRGDEVALVETEKGVIEVEIFENGVIESLVVQPEQKVPVGTTLATLSGDGKKDEAPSIKPAAIAPAPTAPVTEEAAPVKLPIVPATEPSVRLRISPLARKRAQELGIDLSRVAASGGDGSITLADVERAAESVKPAAPAVSPAVGAVKGLDLAAMRRVIAAGMARSKREIPHYYLSTTIDMRKSLDWLAAENAKRPVTKRLLYSVLLIRAVALALRSTPELNGFWIDDGFKAGEGIHVGVAISLRQGGLINPAIHDVDKKTLDELMENISVLVPTYHCPTMVAPITRLAATPVFFPITAEGGPSLDWLRAHADGARAILVPHYFGIPQNLAAVRAFCDELRIALIEDCAHAFFGITGDRNVGAWGDLTTASLTKFFPGPDGGLLVLRCPDAKRVTVRPQPALAEFRAWLDMLEMSGRYGRLGLANAPAQALFRLKAAVRQVP